MMRTVWKFKLSSIMTPVIIMPKGARIIKVGRKKSSPTIWAIVNPDAVKVNRLIRVYETGQPLPDEPGQYLDTIEFLGHVWHLFDGGERPLE